MANTKIKGKLVISIVDADTEQLLPDAGFRIYAADGETVVMEGRTDKDGICEFELEFGKYYYQEFDAPKTGDETNLALLAALAGISLVAVLGIGLLSKEKDKKKENKDKTE